MTHKEIVERMSKWLKKHKQNIAVPNCSLVLKELVTLNHCGETPDILGFNYWSSVMIEVKCSKTDFKADKRKRYRRFSKGSGEFKYYCCPEGLLLPEAIPEEYGLLYIDEKGKVSIIKNAKRQEYADLRVERTMLLSHIRRLTSK